MIKKLNCLMIILILILNLLFPIFSIATDEIVTIKLEDENLYNAIVEEVEDKIESKDDSNQTINITRSNLEEITYLNISDKNIENIAGLGNFTNVLSLLLYDNKIEDISELSKMKKLRTLDLTQNKITDISALSELTEIQGLYLGHEGLGHTGGGSTANGGSLNSSNKISSIEPLKKLNKIKNLEIAGIGVEDISVLENMTELEMLDATSNNIKDISALSKLSSLNYLNLHGNENIKDFQPISNLTNLVELSLGKTGISDISFLNKLTKIERLNLSYNDIVDITPLANMQDLKLLSIGNNSKLENISPLAQCSKLQKLYIPYNNISSIDSLKNLENLEICIAGNKIEDLNVMDKGTINFSESYYFIFSIGSMGGWSMESHPQYLEIKTEEKEVELPPIFVQAQDKNSKLYTDQELELVNCTLNQNKVILDDNIQEATVRVKSGKISGTKFYIKYIDKNPPTLEVSYSTKEITKETVTATITANEKIQQVEGWSLSDDATKLYKEYAKNTQENVKVYDLAGNETETNISINNIDAEAPQAEIKYSTTKPTKQNVKVTINADEEIQSVNGWNLSEDKKTLTKEFENNQEENITIYDLVGNGRKLVISVKNIDKTKPKTEVKYSTTNPTNQNVIVSISSDEEIQEVEGWIISSDHKKLTKEYDKNVEKENITIYDLAGNSSDNEIKISNIDKEPPVLKILYSTTQETNGLVTVEIKANEKIKPIEGWTLNEEQNTLTKEFKENTKEEVTVYDIAGNGTVQNIEINNIKTKDSTVSTQKIPSAGKNIILITIGIGSIILLAIFSYKKYSSYKDIK